MKLLEGAIRRNGTTALLGPGRCGKTALAREIARTHGATMFDLADPGTFEAFEHARRVLDPIRGLVVIDGIERRREVLVTVRSLADGPMRTEPRRSTKFLVVGCASHKTLRTGTDTLVDLATVEAGGLLLSEHSGAAADALWLRGGLPESLLAESEEASAVWRTRFTSDFVERDRRVMGSRRSPSMLRRLWTMVAHRHGTPWNSAEVGRSLGFDDWTVRCYLDELADAWLVRVLPARVENVKKRQRKLPRVFVRDSGLLHTLLGLRTREQLLSHPIAAASWAGFALEQVLSFFPTAKAFFWAAHDGSKVDLLIVDGAQRFAFDFSFSDNPFPAWTLSSAMKILGLERSWVIFPGERAHDLAGNVRAVPVTAIGEELSSRGRGGRP